MNSSGDNNMTWGDWVLMILFIIILSFVWDDSEATAETEEVQSIVVQLHGLSWHADRDANYNERNYGLGIRYYSEDSLWGSNYIAFGQYKNSEHSKSEYAGIGWQWPVKKYITVGIAIGVVTGYKRSDIIPFVVPVVTLWDRIHITGVMIPTPTIEVSVDMVHYTF